MAADTIQEVGGDIMFMGPDGLRLLSATDRIGDFGLAVASRAIQPEINVLRDTYPSYCSVIVRDKSQYRIFGFQTGRLKGASEGYIGTQYVSQDSSSLAWSKLVGIKARVACSIFENLVEYVLFSGEDGYVYRMESGNTFDGSTITSTYYTPYLSITDPVIRKTIFKSHSYFDPEGDVVGTLNLRFNLGNKDKIQPGQDAISNGGTSFAVYGSSTYGSSTFGEVPSAQAIINHKGSGFTVSLEYQFENTAPFVLDTILIEFEQNDRR